MSMALSPSRAADFRTCPLRYRLSAIDRIPEDGDDSAAVRGTITHRHLDEVYAEPRGLRWVRLSERVESYAAFAADVGACREGAIAEGVATALDRYVQLEDPDVYEPAHRELRFDVTVRGVPLRGVVDRLDVRPGGTLARVVDYKTGRAPREQYEAKALWQLRLYAVALRALGWNVIALRLLYLGGTEPQVLDDAVDDLDRFERALVPLWAAIVRAGQTGTFPPRTSRLCDWCSFHALCPAQGGEPPPYPGWPDDQETT